MANFIKKIKDNSYVVRKKLSFSTKSVELTLNEEMELFSVKVLVFRTRLSKYS